MLSRVPFLLRLASLLVAAASVSTSSAQTNDVVQVDPVSVVESPLRAEAEGVSQVRVPDFTPLSLQGLSSLSNHVANLHVNASGAGSFGALFSLRGLANTPYFSEPSVAVYFDEIPLGSAFTYPTELFGFSTVTVSRGPQPSAAGRAGSGGLLRFTSRPSAGAGSASSQRGYAPIAGPSGSLCVSFGNFQSRRAAVEAYSARTERADVSVAAGYFERAGFVENATLGSTVDDQQQTSASARLRIRPSAATELTLQLLGQQRRDGSQPLVPIGGPLFTVQRTREGQTDGDLWGAALKLAVDSGLGRFTATTSHTRWTLDPYDNQLVLPPSLDSRLTQEQSAWNEELHLTSAPGAPTAWHVGAWFSETDGEGTVRRELTGLFPIEGSSFALTTRTLALFGDATFVAGDWQLKPALRLEQVRREFSRVQTVPGPSRATADARFDAVLPKLTAIRALSPATRFTTSIGVGRKPGGWSAYTDDPDLARFRAERAIAYEAGMDTWLANRTVNLAVRVFDYEINDYQIERSFNPVDYLVVNAPRARSRGGEIEALWRVTPGLTVTATVGVTDTTLRRFTDPFTGTRYDGNRAPYTPDHDAHLTAAYRAPEGWFVAADLTAVGRTYYEEAEAAISAAPSRLTASAQLGYETPRWRVTVYGENVTDENYVTLVIPGIGHQVPGSPRTYGVEVAVKW